MCVQRFDDSLNSAIHTTYRISLRSSSMPEPRDPLLKVVIIMFLLTLIAITKGLWFVLVAGEPTKETRSTQKTRVNNSARLAPTAHAAKQRTAGGVQPAFILCNDPSAGSPTETLLRLLLPLNDRV